LVAGAQACTLCGGFNAGGDYEWKSTLIGKADVGVPDAELRKNVARLLANALAVIERDARLKVDLDSATVALLDGDAEVGADVAAGATGLGAIRVRLIYSRSSHKNPQGLKTRIKISRLSALLTPRPFKARWRRP
jgi:hypothetical protein